MTDGEARYQVPIPISEMTLRDYFAAHAPQEPEEWFHNADRAQREAVIGPQPLGRPCSGCYAGKECQATKECLALQDHKKRRAEWVASFEARWRWAYADLMLEWRR